MAKAIDKPNPGPAPSRLPDSVLSLAAEFDKTKLDDVTRKGIKRFRQAADYIAAGTYSVSLIVI